MVQHARTLYDPGSAACSFTWAPNLGHRTETLFTSPGLDITDFRCDGRCGRHPLREEATARHEIAITRQGSWRRHDESGRHLADVTRVMLFNRGAPYVVEHPVNGGDHCVVIGFDDSHLAQIASDLGVKLGGDRAPFRLAWTAASARVQLLSARLHSPAMKSALACEELCLEILGCVLAQLAPSADAVRVHTRALNRRRDLAHAVEIELARSFTEEIALPSLARKMASSPFHLCRVFKEVTGETIHQRLLSLRLSAALAHLADSRDPIGTIAQNLGFADHAHLTALFARRFRLTPSAFRRTHAAAVRE